MKRVCILTNVPSPYRLPIFEEIGKHYSLEVKFCRHSESGRYWNWDLENNAFDHEFLEGFDIGPVRVNIQVLSTLQNNDYDICILGEGPLYPVAMAAVVYYSKRQQIPLVIWTEGIDVKRKHESNVRDFPRMLGRNAYDILIRRRVYQVADGCIAYSGEMTNQFLQKRGVDSTDIFTGTQIMPQTQMGPRNINTIEHDNFRILVISYLIRRKGIDDLIEVCQSLEGRKTELVIAGSGPDESRLKEIASNSDNIQFTGYVDESSKWDLYRQADLFVLPTYLDTWGMVVNEAMYFGTPVITTEAAGASQLVKDNRCGIVVPDGDVSKLRAAIIKIIDNSELREKYSKNALEATDAWNVETGASSFIDAIETLS